MSTWRPRQVLDLEFTGRAGQGIGIWPSDVGRTCPTAQLYQGDQLVPRRFAGMVANSPEMQSAWQLLLDGTYRMRL